MEFVSLLGLLNALGAIRVGIAHSEIPRTTESRMRGYGG